MFRQFKQHQEAIWFLVILGSLLGLTAWIYLPGTSGPFILDDFSNLSPLGDYGGITSFDTFRQFVFSNSSGPTGRPVAMMSFLIDAQDWPASIAQFKYTNIMIHLLCGASFCWLAFLLAERLGLSQRGASQVALVVTMLWLVHPLNVSTALYVIQRMTQLMTLFATLSLVFYLLGRRAMENRKRTASLCLVLSLFPFGLLALLSKENGAFLLLTIVIIETLFFRNHLRNWIFTLWYRWAVVLPMVLVIAYLAYTAPGIIEAYEYRSFSLIERLLSETRILSLYIWKIFFPDTLLGSVFHDQYPVSTGLFSPGTTALSIVFIAGLLAAAFWLRRRQPVFSFAVFWFFALHVTESTYVPLELYFEHRNYLPMFGPLFAVAWYFRALVVSSIDKSAKWIAGGVIAGLFLLSTWLTGSVIQVWGDEDRFYAYMTEQRPQSVRARLVYIEHLETGGQLEAALEQHYILREYYPNELVVLLNLWNFACRYNLDQPMTLAEISAIPDLQLSIGNINFQLERIEFNLRSGACRVSDLDGLLAVYDRVADYPMRPGRTSLYYYNYANIHLLLGQAQQALEKLETGMAIQASVSIRLRQAVIAGLMGDFQAALVYTEHAREADLLRRRLMPSREPEIQRLEAIIRRQLEGDLQ